MPLLQLQNVDYSVGGPLLLEQINFTIDPGERVCIVGRNGAGKSTLMRLVAGEIQPDDGEIRVQGGVVVARMAQEVPQDTRGSVFDVVAQGLGDLGALLARYHHAVHDGDMDAMAAAQTQIEARHGWDLNRRVTQVLEKLDLPDEAEFVALSGGMKRRVLLGQALVRAPDILLLDEPTNHLDIEAIDWLEGFLKAFTGSIVFVTHDRSFLRALATRIVEIDRGQLTSWPGDYDNYLRRREERLHAQAQENACFDKLLAQEEVWIRQGIKARRTRNEGRVLRLERLRRERAARRERQGKVELALDAGDRSGKLVAALEHAGKRFGEQVVVRDFSCRVQRGDKIGIIGPNGAGKTTLLRMILGELLPDTGKVHLGTKVQVAYFDQFRSQLDEQATLIDVISPGSDFVEIAHQRKHVISYLGDFLFAPQRARSQVSSLSGGERNRLLLARLFARPANVLVLDEPTNDLDIETLELLEELLQDYTGTLFLVSHDRAFIDNVVTQTIAAEGDGIWREYAGGYQDWADYQAVCRREEASTMESSSKRGDSRPAEVARPTRPKASASKLSWKEAKELAELPQRIAALEAEQKQIGERLADPALYQAQPQAARELSARLREIDEQLLALLDRWETLES